MSYDTVAENSRNLAKKYVREGKFGRAFSHYLVALKLKPDWREQFREEFSTVLCKWGTILDEGKRYRDLFMCYEQAIEVYPDDAVILNNLGSHLLRCGLLKEATHYFRKCLSIDRYFIRAAHNLENVSNLSVERWHFRMLNDEHRNEAFREAIIKKVRQGFSRVLDIGTGTGLLSLFCIEGQAKETYACDSSPVMIEIAERVFLSNNAPDIKLIGKHSTDIVIPEDIPQRVSLVVTETFDAGLLGEDILHTLTRAWERLLLPPHPKLTELNPDRFGLVLPFGAVLHVTGIEFDAVANDFHLKETRNSFQFENCHVCRRCESYDTHDLSRSEFKCLTPTKKIAEFNFNDPSSFTDVLRGCQREMTLEIDSSGRLDCFAVWFDLHLDEDIVLNTGPLSKTNAAWDQAIFPLPRSILVEENQNVTVVVAFENGKLEINCVEKDVECRSFELSESAIQTLNNENLTEAFREVEGKLLPRFDGPVSVLDWYPFPVFGLNFLIDRSDRFVDRLTCVVPTEEDRRLVYFMAEKYGLVVDVLVKTENDLEGCFQDKMFDMILVDFAETTGEIKDGVLLEMDYLKSLLNPNGIILPEKVTVIGQFLYSDWLSRASMVVDDSVTSGYKIADFVNVYQVHHFIDFDLKNSEKSFCSEPFELFSLLESLESVTEKTVALQSDICSASGNGMVYYLKIRFLEGCNEILTNGDSFHHQAVFLFPITEFFDCIKFKVIRKNGLFNIELLKSYFFLF